MPTALAALATTCIGVPTSPVAVESASAIVVVTSSAIGVTVDAEEESRHSMCTRLCDNTKMTKEFMDGMVRYSSDGRRALIAYVGADVEPSSHLDTMQDPKWRSAMDVEFGALLENKTWRLVPPQPRANVIDFKRVFKIKRRANGNTDRYKVQLVV